MAERKKTPDILADLLGDNPPVSSKTVKQQDSETAKQRNSETASEEEETGTSAKVKVTFYLSEDAVEMLEDAQRQLRRLGRSAGKNPISKAATSKSALLEEALKIACADLEARGMESQLAALLL